MQAFTPPRRWFAVVPLLAAGLCLGDPALAASYGAEASVLARAHSPFVPEPDPINRSSSSQAVPALAWQEEMLGDSSARSWVAGWAGVGAGGLHLNAYSRSQAAVGQAYAYSIADARGDFSDQFVLSVPGLANGTALTATVAFKISVR